MRVIVIRQPWAWLIVNGFKDIENRSWRTRYRGPLLIQASARRPSKQEMEDFRVFARKRGAKLPDEFEFGGIVGRVSLERERDEVIPRGRRFGGAMSTKAQHPSTIEAPISLGPTEPQVKALTLRIS